MKNTQPGTFCDARLLFSVSFCESRTIRDSEDAVVLIQYCTEKSRLAWEGRPTPSIVRPATASPDLRRSARRLRPRTNVGLPLVWPFTEVPVALSKLSSNSNLATGSIAVGRGVGCGCA